eukprot:7233650-Prymnesium_polylepis.1
MYPVSPNLGARCAESAGILPLRGCSAHRSVLVHLACACELFACPTRWSGDMCRPVLMGHTDLPAYTEDGRVSPLNDAYLVLDAPQSARSARHRLTAHHRP